MSGKKERGLWELAATDPEKIDAELWSKQSGPFSRRRFLKSGAAALSAFLGARFFFESHAALSPSAAVPIKLTKWFSFLMTFETH